MGLAEVDGNSLQPEEITSKGLEFHVCTINKSVHRKKSGHLFNDPRIYIYIYMCVCVCVCVCVCG